MTRSHEGEPQPTCRGGQNRKPIRYADFSEVLKDKDYIRTAELVMKEFEIVDFEVEILKRREEGLR